MDGHSIFEVLSKGTAHMMNNTSEVTDMDGTHDHDYHDLRDDG